MSSSSLAGISGGKKTTGQAEERTARSITIRKGNSRNKGGTVYPTERRKARLCLRGESALEEKRVKSRWKSNG